MSVMIVFPPHGCVRCAETADGRGRSQKAYRFEVQEGGLYTLTCDAGHDTLCQLQHAEFEILFEIGLLALMDGYYREAVLDFASALERFQEYYLRFLAHKGAISQDAVESMWTLVKGQSERQTGAFYFAHLLERGEIAPHLSRRLTEVRNDIVHRGRILTRREAVEYGDSVLSVIRPVLECLKTKQPDAMRLFITNDRDRRSPGAVDGLVFETALSTAYAHRPSIDDADLDAILGQYPGLLRLKNEKGLPGLTLDSYVPASA